MIDRPRRIEPKQGIQPIQKDQPQKDRYYHPPGEEEEEAKTIVGSVMMMLKKIFAPATSWNEPKKVKISPAESDVKKDIDDILALLCLHQTKDQSGNAQFSQRLSMLWHALLHHYEKAVLSKDSTHFHLEKITEFFKAVEDYPPEEDHHIGYYLTLHTGEEWLPFPYMEILKNLHADYQKNGTRSELARWVKLLQDATLA